MSASYRLPTDESPMTTFDPKWPVGTGRNRPISIIQDNPVSPKNGMLKYLPRGIAKVEIPLKLLSKRDGFT